MGFTTEELHGAWVTLTPIEVEFCDWLGIERNRTRNATGSKHTNNRRVTDAEAIAGHQLGTRTECAGKTYLWMTKWHVELLNAQEAHDRPDLEHPRVKIDVKGVPRHRHQLISPAAAVKSDWVYLLISAQDHPRYWLRGWCTGKELARAPLKELQPNRSCHAIAAKALRPPQELLLLVCSMLA